MSPVYLGIDLGTQSVKALCYQVDPRKPVAVVSSPLKLISRADGTREQLAKWWVAALQDCLSRIDPDIRQRIAAIGVSGQQHGFVPLAADGAVLAPVKLWCDTTTVEECNELTAAFGGTERCIAEVGNPILPGYTASKILWMKKHQPDLYRRLHTILLPHDYLNFYLTGERVMEHGDASGTGLLDIRSRQWHRGMLSALDRNRDLLGCLPALAEPGAIVGQLCPALAAELGLPAGVPVSAGGGDNMMAAVGTGNVVPGRLTISLGTSGTLFAYADQPVVDESGTLAAFCASTGGWLPLLCTMNCTAATELTRELFQVPVAELDAHIGSARPGSDGVLTLPFFNGERTPNLPRAKGCVFGLQASNFRSENLMRSAMESAVYGLRVGMDAFIGSGCSVDAIRLTGGGARSANWRQMVADVFKLPVSVQKVDEGAALGAALQAYWVHAGHETGFSSLVDFLDEHLEIDEPSGARPDAGRASRYDEYYQQYLQHVAAVTPLYT